MFTCGKHTDGHVHMYIHTDTYRGSHTFTYRHTEAYRNIQRHTYTQRYTHRNTPIHKEVYLHTGTHTEHLSSWCNKDGGVGAAPSPSSEIDNLQEPSEPCFLPDLEGCQRLLGPNSYFTPSDFPGELQAVRHQTALS